MFKLKAFCGYAFTKQIDLSLFSDENLNSFEFTSPVVPVASSMGFEKFEGLEDDYISLASDDNKIMALKIRIDERKLKPAHINKVFKERVDRHISEQGRHATKDEKNAIKEGVIEDLLAKTIPDTSIIYVVINFERQQLWLSTSSTNTAENALALIRKATGSLPVIPAIVQMMEEDLILNPEVFWSSCVAKGNQPKPFTLGSKVKFTDVVSGAKGSGTNLEELSESWVVNLAESSVVTEIELVLEDFSMTVTDSFAIKTIKLPEEFGVEGGETDDDVESFMSQILLCDDLVYSIFDALQESMKKE